MHLRPPPKYLNQTSIFCMKNEQARKYVSISIVICQYLQVLQLST